MNHGESDPKMERLARPECEPEATVESARSARPPVRAAVMGWTFAQALRALHATWRKNVHELAILDEMLARRQPHILAFWHRKYVALFPLLRGRHACVVTNNAPHGHVVASICRHFGNVAIQINERGSGTESLNLMGHAFAHRSEVGITVDGPLGPYHKVKRGAIQVASDLGHWIVPVSVAARSKHVFVRRWDRLEIPKLFTHVHLSVGEPMQVPPDLSSAGLVEWRVRLHDVLEEVDAEAEKKVLQDQG